MMTALRLLSFNSNIWFIWVLSVCWLSFFIQVEIFLWLLKIVCWKFWRLWVSGLYLVFYFSLRQSPNYCVVWESSRHLCSVSSCGCCNVGPEVQLPHWTLMTLGVKMPTRPASHHLFLPHWYYMGWGLSSPLCAADTRIGEWNTD